jgi:hypothetical protein
MAATPPAPPGWSRALSQASPAPLCSLAPSSSPWPRASLAPAARRGQLRILLASFSPSSSVSRSSSFLPMLVMFPTTAQISVLDSWMPWLHGIRWVSSSTSVAPGADPPASSVTCLLIVAPCAGAHTRHQLRHVAVPPCARVVGRLPVLSLLTDGSTVVSPRARPCARHRDSLFVQVTYPISSLSFTTQSLVPSRGTSFSMLNISRPRWIHHQVLFLKTSRSI